MKIVATVVDAGEAALAAGLCPDLVEARIDLMEVDPARELPSIRLAFSGPVILTIRSVAEGGEFSGGPGAWWECLEPLLPFGDLIDVETPCSSYSPRIRRLGKGIIASRHAEDMPAPAELRRLERELRSYGDIPKIVVRPRNEHDLLDLLEFTLETERPVCTGVLGDAYRFARVILPLFGSELAYTHAGTCAAPGQYALGDFKKIQALLGT
ncbi:MAG TPA: type I 3-dehydroquinate dehydratase [Methanomicrobiales archaeon]|nr:type I 3-dehydroquinate dehydratase [Methanomicrobiales archaeon]